MEEKAVALRFLIIQDSVSRIPARNTTLKIGQESWSR